MAALASRGHNSLPSRQTNATQKAGNRLTVVRSINFERRISENLKLDLMMKKRQPDAKISEKSISIQTKD